MGAAVVPLQVELNGVAHLTWMLCTVMDHSHSSLVLGSPALVMSAAVVPPKAELSAVAHLARKSNVMQVECWEARHW